MSSPLGKINPRELTLSLLTDLLGSSIPPHLRIRLWDGTYWPEQVPNASDGANGGRDQLPATVVLNHPGALRQMLLGNSEKSLGEAYLGDDFDVEGDMEAAVEFGDLLLSDSTQGCFKKLLAAKRLLQLPARTPVSGTAMPRRANLRDEQHSPERDRAAIGFHYDISNAFFNLWLDSSKVYSCAYFPNEADDLETAQNHKLDTVCRKLGLKPGDRLMDIGCGWGGLILHAAAAYGVEATGITLSTRQAEYVQERLRPLGLENRVEVRLQDYRDAADGKQYDAVVSVGMVEHVGRTNLPLYFRSVDRLLKPGGLFLNHGIATGVVPIPQRGDSFMDHYVFPDGDLLPIAEMNSLAETAGFELRDVENLREHYVLTLRHWVRRLEANHEEALKFVSEPIYRTWRLYMAGSAHRFKTGRLAVYQSLFAKLDSGRGLRIPLQRSAWYEAN